jgi:hypothetical protein
MAADLVGFYHIAAMGHWREVVAEQLRLLARVFRGPLKVGLIADQWEDGYVHQCLKTAGMDYELIHYAPGLRQYEFPTLLALEAACRADDAPERVFYLHTKGVSDPGWKKQQWRWLMNRELIGHILVRPQADLCCANWVDKSPPTFPHAEGNFWLARSDYIRRLPDLATFRKALPTHPHCPRWDTDMDRYAAELWPGQAQPQVVSRYHNAGLWIDDFWTSREQLQQELMAFHL